MQIYFHHMLQFFRFRKTPAGIGVGVWLLLLCFSGCAGDRRHQLIVSVPDQHMLVLRDGQPLTSYPISTSKFGLGSQPGSYATPVGEFRIRQKIGDGLPAGAVFKSRVPTGEVLPVDAPGRDPIVTRILWLHGQEPHNRNAFERFIYIHGTPEERTIGTPASYGCIRMRSRDVMELYDTVGVGARVTITTQSLGLGRNAPPPVVNEAELSF
jgi:lipoprotein-anchoring transpeptidase ErfK/SrfK